MVFLQAHQPFNNCFNYGNNMMTDSFAQPGRAAGQKLENITGPEVKKASQADGLKVGLLLLFFFFFIPVRLACSSFNGNGKFCLVCGLRQLKQDTKCESSNEKLYWLATSGGRVPVVAVCVLYGQLRICCVSESALL